MWGVELENEFFEAHKGEIQHFMALFYALWAQLC